MTTIKYTNTKGKNGQYDFRYFDNFTDGDTKSPIDTLVSPDEITMYFKKDTINTTVKIMLPGNDNLYLLNNILTTNTTIL